MNKLRMSLYTKWKPGLAGSAILMTISAFHSFFQFGMRKGIVLVATFVAHYKDRQEKCKEDNLSFH
jgi:hypothetical protein